MVQESPKPNRLHDHPSHQEPDKALQLKCQCAAHIVDLHRTIAARDKAISDLYALLEQRNSCLAERMARVQELERLVLSKDKELEALTKQLRVRVEEERELRRRYDKRQAQLSSVYSSRSWRITRPLRTLSRVCRLRWFVHNTRRTLKLMGWLATGQLGRAGTALLPYCRRFLPSYVKKLVPAPVRRMVRRQDLTMLTGARPATSTVQQEARRPCAARDEKYLRWIEQNDTLSDHDRTLIRGHIAALQERPKISVLMPVHSVEPQQLQEGIDSVLSQLYGEWELCLAFSTSVGRKVRSTLEHHAHHDGRVKLRSVRTREACRLFRRPRGSLTKCANTSLDLASGDWIVLMDPHDVIAEHAFYLVAEAINRDPEARIIYSDEDKINASGQRFDPYFKPNWDYDLFLGQNMLGRVAAYRADLAHAVGGFRKPFEHVYDWDFALRVLEATPSESILHVPFVLYHRRESANAHLQSSKKRACNAAQRAVNEHFERTGQAATAAAIRGSTGLRIKWALPFEPPLVSVIIPTKDQCSLLQACVDGLLNRTDYTPLEIVIVDNGSSEQDALAFLAGLHERTNVKVVEDPGPFNFSRLVNRGAAASSGEVLVFLNNDVDVITPVWLSEMVSHALRPEVGAVGAKLYYVDDTLQHGGVILGLGGVAGHVHKGLPRESPGYFSRLNLVHGLSCVTGACLATRRNVFSAVGGFDEQELTDSYNDVDFCIRVKQAGYRIILPPQAELYHLESVSRGHPRASAATTARFEAEQRCMRQRWGSLLTNDPHYNPNLSLRYPSHELADKPRARKPWVEHIHVEL